MTTPNRRRATPAWIAAALLVAFGLPKAAHAAPALVFEPETGTVLHHEQAHDLWSPASLTKLMTAYVAFRALEAGDLTLRSPVRVTANAVSTPPSRMGYPSGSVMTIDNALKMVIVRSANDIAVALGEAVAGSEAAFVARMNEEAARLGMTNTNFVNPHGLHDEQQYTTARDMAVLARALKTDFADRADYFAIEAISFGEQLIPSYNLLLGRFDGADGMKTGFVCASGFNLIASATRGGRTLVAVVMGTESQKERAEKSATLLDQGFNGSAPSAGAVDLASVPGTDADGVPADLRPVVCTEEARAARWDGRDVDGNIVFDTDLIGTMDREPRAARVGLGGAEGASMTAIVLGGAAIDAYPVPTPRPYRPSLASEAEMERYQLRPGFDVPVPASRPESG
ncbi:MAG: D-alanyl-D-alanine carboxypeptidase [Roseitalea sp.]|jgi:D-alanyl-D-alanine carboxypeptidase|nr:D-alanyl-D-alanine carboxypeptidase [Roseitalea sp.]MBO6723648.1 D-alanyl-D-alanine carboxypeptidase [Roseitalea sp.]MBO6744163.1 D-alanyl-D-alanine carboxypeptidase [Roseitalea sp.]